MAKYTIEDIEILRRKSGISYEEAVNLLEYHNGSLARAMMDLEKNGRLNKGTATVRTGKGIRSVIDYLYRLHLIIRKGNTTVVNVSMLFVLLVLATAAHLCIIGLVLSLALGYHISVGSEEETDADSEKTSKTPHRETAAEGKRPVQVHFSGKSSVDVRDNGDGYHEADIH